MISELFARLNFPLSHRLVRGLDNTDVAPLNIKNPRHRDVIVDVAARAVFGQLYQAIVLHMAAGSSVHRGHRPGQLLDPTCLCVACASV